MSDSRNNAIPTSRLPSAGTGLGDFTGGAIVIAASGEITPANDRGGAILAELSDASAAEIVAAARRAIAGNAVRLDRIAGPIFGRHADAVTLPLLDGATALVLVITDPAEAALHRSIIEGRKRYQQLVDASSDFVWETDSLGRFVFLSGQGALGYAARNMLGRRASDFVLDTSSLPFPIFQARETVLATDVWLQRADGSISCQMVTAMPLLDANGVWCGARGMARDVTEQRESERRHQQLQMHKRLMAYLGYTFASEADADKALPAALAGTGLAIGADGGMIVNGHPASTTSEMIVWGRRLPDRDVAELRVALAEQGIVDTTRGDLEVNGVATEAAPGSMGTMNGAVLVWRDLHSGRFSDGDRALLKAVAGRLGSVMRPASSAPIAAPPKAHSGVISKSAFTAELERRLAELVAEQMTGALVHLASAPGAGAQPADADDMTVAGMLRRRTRTTDLICRVDDDFLVWLEGVLATGAPARIEALIGNGGRDSPDSSPPKLIAGVAIFDGAQSETVDALQHRAKAALDRARRTGGAGFVIAEAILLS